MLRAKGTAGASIKEGKIMLRFVGEDGKGYDVLLPLKAATEAVGAILRAASDLPRDPQAHATGAKVEGITIQGSFALALNDKMQPLLAANLNGIELAVPLTETQLRSLRDDMSQLLDVGKRKH